MHIYMLRSDFFEMSIDETKEKNKLSAQNWLSMKKRKIYKGHNVFGVFFSIGLRVNFGK